MAMIMMVKIMEGVCNVVEETSEGCFFDLTFAQLFQINISITFAKGSTQRLLKF